MNNSLVFKYKPNAVYIGITPINVIKRANF